MYFGGPEDLLELFGIVLINVAGDSVVTRKRQPFKVSVQKGSQALYK